MAFTYDEIKARTASAEYSYGDRETMLYALGLGMGRAPLDPQELRYTYEKSLKTVPTMAALFSARGNLLDGVNYTMVVHGEQRVTLHQPLPWQADLIVESRVAEA